MAIKKFGSHEEAIKAGYPNPMGNDEYSQGGEQVSRERYAKLFEVLSKSYGSQGGDVTFSLPDLAEIMRMRADEWLPIETAPKDGTKILIWAGEVIVSHWENQPALDWNDWVDAEGFRLRGYDITHWMPLPKPPAHR